MAAEENDEGAVSDIVAEVERLREILERLEFRRMFSHEMDPNNCYLDIRAGSGRVPRPVTGPTSCCACTCAGPTSAASAPRSSSCPR